MLETAIYFHRRYMRCFRSISNHTKFNYKLVEIDPKVIPTPHNGLCDIPLIECIRVTLEFKKLKKLPSGCDSGWTLKSLNDDFKANIPNLQPTFQGYIYFGIDHIEMVSDSGDIIFSMPLEFK